MVYPDTRPMLMNSRRKTYPEPYQADNVTKSKPMEHYMRIRFSPGQLDAQEIVW